ncbi:hypothetical protein BHM03_00023067 [Ensete ventricosum]|nr:hypothetical protein BHM03_00023067 [Ensete ventricosum]
MGLLKQRSWSPDSDREEAWLRRQSINRGRRGRLALTRTRSVTDEDLDELRGCIDLGFGFDADSPLADARRLSDTLPALDLYYAVHRGSPAGSPPSESSSSDGSAASPDLGSPVSFFSAGTSPENSILPTWSARRRALWCCLSLVLSVCTWAFEDFLLVSKGCVGSLGYRLVGWEPRRSPRARVDLWSLMKLQSFGICCNVSGEVTYPRSLGRAQQWRRCCFPRTPAASSTVAAPWLLPPLGGSTDAFFHYSSLRLFLSAAELNVALLCSAGGTGAGAVAPLDPPSVASPL